MLATANSRNDYVGAGNVGPFPYTFKIWAASDLRVLKRSSLNAEAVLAYPADFSATGIGKSAGGNVTLTNALAAGETLAITRVRPLTQTTDLRNESTYFREDTEDAFDKLVMLDQQQNDAIARSLSVLESYNPGNLNLKVKPEIGKVLTWLSNTQLGNSQIDTNGIAVPGEGRTVPTATAYLLNNRVYNVKDYGAQGDDFTDDYPAIQAAIDAMPTTGGILYFPTATRYRLSQSLHITKPIIVRGQIRTQSSTIAPTGTVLSFAPDITGVFFEGDTTFGNGIQGSRGYAANYAIIENIGLISRGGKTGLLNGGTGAAVVDGIRIRAPGVQVRNVWIQDFHRDAIRIWASVGSGDNTLIGNANAWLVERCWYSNCGGSGISTFGSDVNAGLALLCTISLMGDRGVLDQSFLGNTYVALNTFSNAVRSYETTAAMGGVNACTFLGCYSEYTGEPHAIILKPSIVIGGQLSGAGAIDPSSTAPVWNGVNLGNGHIQHTNNRGTTAVGSFLGYDTNGQIVQAYGNFDDIISLDNQTLAYITADGWYRKRNRGSDSRIIYEEPTNVGAPRAWTLAFRNGILFGAGKDTGVLMHIGSAAPSTGTWARGDVVWNSLPGINKPMYWQCTVAGTPGTWVAGPPIDIFSGDVGDADRTWAFVTDPTTMRYNTPLTVARAFNLPAGSAALTGVRVRIVREAGATGAFNLDLKNSAGTTLKSLTTASQWAEFLCDGATFRLVAAGNL